MCAAHVTRQLITASSFRKPLTTNAVTDFLAHNVEAVRIFFVVPHQMVHLHTQSNTHTKTHTHVRWSTCPRSNRQHIQTHVPLPSTLNYAPQFYMGASFRRPRLSSVGCNACRGNPLRLQRWFLREEGEGERERMWREEREERKEKG